MIELRLTEIAEAIDGRLVLPEVGYSPDTVVNGEAQTDSREITAGGIFFVRTGENADGHEFVPAAVENGAELVIVQRELDLAIPQIVVADTTRALGALAAEVVARVRAAGQLKVVGITGSNGKTTTKNLVAQMLAPSGKTVASLKSFNNEVGGPLTMLRVTADTRFLVVEMGASGPGEISQLTALAKPDIGVVLMVGKAHAGGFGGLEVTAKTKQEMVVDLPETAVAVLNQQDPFVARMAANTKARVRWFGAGSDLFADEIKVSAQGTEFMLHLGAEKMPVHFPVLGEHHVANALAATAVATECGVSLSTIVEVLERTVRPAKWRMEVSRLANDITVINDAYNANPESMAAGLKTLTQVADPAGRSIAVLGEMSELGDEAGAEHDRIGLLAVRLRLGKLVVVGKNVRRMYISAINEGAWDESEAHYFESSEEALKFLKENLQPRDTVLIKSSNAAGLRFLGDELVEALS